MRRSYSLSVSMWEALEENFREFSGEFEVIIHCWLISSRADSVCKIEMTVTAAGTGFANSVQI